MHFEVLNAGFVNYYKSGEIAFGQSRPDRSTRGQSVDKKLVGFFCTSYT